MSDAAVKKYAAILFDLDGTLIDSTPAVVAHWTNWGNEFSIEPALILATSHGRRTIDIIKDWKPELANKDYVLALETEIPKKHADDAKELPGARALVESLQNSEAKWAIVTSGTSGLAFPWIKIMGFPTPKVFITADNVENGKPDPEGYLLARKQLGLPADATVLVLEDAPAGIRAGKAAGCDVVGLLTTHKRDEVEAARPDFVVENLVSVEFGGMMNGEIVVRIGGEEALKN